MAILLPYHLKDGKVHAFGELLNAEQQKAS